MEISTWWKKLGVLAQNLQPRGCYSIERLRRFKCYTDDSGCARLLLTCLLTPLPCVALTTLVESVTLAPPEAGPYANYAFWIRAWLVTGFVDYSMVLQLSQSLARLKIEPRYIVLVALVGSVISFAAVFGVAVFLVFPVPFSMLVASPPSVIVILVGFSCMWGRRWQNDSRLRRDLARHTMVFMCQVALTFTYPLYIFGFSSLSGWRQTAFVLLLPTIKSAGKHWISAMLANQNDIKPEVVIFNVEVFNALYVSNAVQNSSSLGTTVALMVIDVVHFWLSMRGTLGLLDEVKTLMRKIPPHHPAASESFVDVALQLLVIENRAQLDNQFRSKRSSQALNSVAPKTSLILKSMEPTKASTLVRTPTRAELLSVLRTDRRNKSIFKRMGPKTIKIFPTRPLQHSTVRDVSIYTSSKAIDQGSQVNQGLETIFSHHERVAFIITSTRVLYITEYLVLVEYTEAVLPMVFALYSVIAFHLPNGVYIQSFAALSGQQLFTNAGYVLAYSTLELISLVLAMGILKRMLGISSLHQLGFVLETQAEMVQSKLMLWFLYVMQVPLAHVGTDYSFKFKWAHTAP